MQIIHIIVCCALLFSCLYRYPIFVYHVFYKFSLTFFFYHLNTLSPICPSNKLSKSNHERIVNITIFYRFIFPTISTRIVSVFNTVWSHFTCFVSNCTFGIFSFTSLAFPLRKFRTRTTVKSTI